MDRVESAVDHLVLAVEAWDIKPANVFLTKNWCSGTLGLPVFPSDEISFDAHPVMWFFPGTFGGRHGLHHRGIGPPPRSTRALYLMGSAQRLHSRAGFFDPRSSSRLNSPVSLGVHSAKAKKVVEVSAHIQAKLQFQSESEPSFHEICPDPFCNVKEEYSLVTVSRVDTDSTGLSSRPPSVSLDPFDCQVHPLHLPIQLSSRSFRQPRRFVPGLAPIAGSLLSKAGGTITVGGFKDDKPTGTPTAGSSMFERVSSSPGEVDDSSSGQESTFSEIFRDVNAEDSDDDYD